MDRKNFNNLNNIIIFFFIEGDEFVVFEILDNSWK